MNAPEKVAGSPAQPSARLVMLICWWLLRLQWRRRESIPLLLERMAGWASFSSSPEPEAVAGALRRVFRVARRVPGLWSSCIPRALIAAALLRGRSGAVLRIGLSRRPGADGHAWFCIGERVLLPEDREWLAREPHVVAESLPLGP